MFSLTSWHRWALVLPLLGGCSSQFQFSSNLDSDAVDEYFKPGKVRVYQGNTPPAAQRDLGLLEATSCQADGNAVPASEADARTQLRRLAADQGANAIWISQCIELSADKHCQHSIVCYARALVVHED
ncbi:RcsF protein [Ferrimonas sediminum]|uniref:RcsF protein n=1 Tax=Ferrimonas sediminum TaxID=718193 RepID=A0A1G8LJ65_9GAMM|nr:Rcs stress response system protein RcsF [Ferrimonas sediminum]SDI55698.1 RcsF protein [Ferrimonas sediminum]